MEVLIEDNRLRVELDLPALNEGGEGVIYPLWDKRFVAKVFHHPSAERGKKLEAMIESATREMLRPSKGFWIAWPLDRLIDPARPYMCLGYVMYQATDKVPLYNFLNPEIRPEWADSQFLLLVARNLAAAVSAVHRAGHIIGDINESNILVGKNAEVTIVDTDSFQITVNQHCYPCTVGRPEYTPPELHGVDFSKVARSQHHDAFGLAVLIFRLFMEGNHPFAARFLGSGERLSLEERIRKGIWPYSRAGSTSYVPRKEAPPYQRLPMELQILFRICFEAGHHNPDARPSADLWRVALDNTIASNRKSQPAWSMFRKKLNQQVVRANEAIQDVLHNFRPEWVVLAAVIVITVALVLMLVCRQPSAQIQGEVHGKKIESRFCSSEGRRVQAFTAACREGWHFSEPVYRTAHREGPCRRVLSSPRGRDNWG